jgi:putative flippase GtrA
MNFSDMNLHVFRDYSTLIKFLSAGFGGLIVENSALFLLHGLLSVNLYFSKFIALEAAIVTVFFLNDRFAFKEFEKKAYALLRTNIVRAGGTLISFLGLYIGVEIGFHYLIANTGGVAVGSMFNYYFERITTWDSV